MFLHVTKAEYEGGYQIRLQFNDGAEGVVDLEEELEGEVFGPLQDPREFADFRLDPQLHTIVWNNGADLAPEYLKSLLQVAA